jgi:hypothetical protein
MSMRTVVFLCVIFFAGLICPAGRSQEKVKSVLVPAKEPKFSPVVFNESEMKSMWDQFRRDKGWETLEKEVARKGYVRITNKEASWGFHGTIVDTRGVTREVMFCAFDFLNSKDTKQGCSMIWRMVDGEFYKAYVIFPSGERDIDKRFANSEEWFVDRQGAVQKAHSWGKCFRACVQRGNTATGVEVEIGKDKSRIKVGDSNFTVTCQTQCFASALACAGLASATAITTAGVIAASGGTLTIPTLIAAGGFGAAVLIGCAATGCGTCIFLCALGCI